MLPFEVDTERVFCELFGASPTSFWLDGGLGDPSRSRFSFLGDAEGPWSEVLEYRVGSGVVTCRGPARTLELPGTIFDVLGDRLADRSCAPTVNPLPFVAGYVGYLGYETKADCGSPNRHRATTPDAAWLFADRLVAVDHLRKVSHLVVTEPRSADPEPGRAWMATTATTLEALGPLAEASDSAAGPPVALYDVERWLVRDRERYLADVEDCLDALRAGDSYQLCLTNTAVIPCAAGGPDIFDRYCSTRRRNLGQYSGFLRFGAVSIASSSPECFLRIEASGVIESKPIKGTVARSSDPEEDERRGRELAGDPKARAENLMIVDLVRNDLGRIASIGSVSVPELMALQTYANVHHLVSTVRATKRAEVSAIRVVQECFPPGSMTGAPKLRAMEILDRLEGRARGPYSGVLGYLGCDGAADLSVVIRTAVRDEFGTTIGAGGGIVLDSQPQQEYAEMLTKMATPLAGRPDV